MVVLAFAGAYLGAAQGGGRASVAALRAPPPPACTPTQRAAQAASFNRSTPAGNVMASACPSLAILAALATADPSAAALTLVNVGANKGYAIAEVAALWRPDLGVTPASVYARLKAAHPDAPVDAIRGVCGDGEEAVPEVVGADAARRPPALAVHAVEPVPPNVGLLRRLEADVVRAGAAAPAPVTMAVHAGAVGPASAGRLGYDPAACEHVGQESCQMQALRAGLAPVAAWTLDGFFTANGLGVARGPRRSQPRSVFLKIDAEGYDGAILMSAGTGPGSALDAVRAVEFEYHNVGAWGPANDQVRLADVVSKLDGAGFDCYLEFGAHLVALSGACWHEAYEFFQWSNVLCVRRNDAWADAAAALAVWKREDGGA